MNFDINAIEESTKQTFDVIVGHLDEEKTKPAGFRIVGPGSEEFASAERHIQLLNIKDAAKRKEALNLETDDGAQVVIDGAEARKLALINRCVVGWFGFKDGEKDAEFNQANLARVLKSRPHWIRRLLSEIESEANFMAG
jgi:hypothetical protein